MGYFQIDVFLDPMSCQGMESTIHISITFPSHIRVGSLALCKKMLVIHWIPMKNIRVN